MTIRRHAFFTPAGLFAAEALVLAAAGVHAAGGASAEPVWATSKAAEKAAMKPLPTLVRVRACIFDPVGNNGPIADLAKDLVLEARKYGLLVEPKIHIHEQVAAEDFKAGQCEMLGVSTLRARQFNRVVGSIDSPGNLRSYAEVKTLLRSLAHPAFEPMALVGRYQVVGVLPIGALYVMTRDRAINSIEKAAGKRVGVLDWDTSQSRMISSIGAQPVPSDITSYGGKFNNGQVDIIAAPAIAYQPLELHKGIGTKGGVFRFPLLHATGTLMIRRDLLIYKIPDLDVRLRKLREYGLGFLDNFIVRLQAAEKTIPPQVWMTLSPEEHIRYQRMLRQARIKMTADGVYDTSMMNLLKRVRCKHEPGNEECSTFEE